MEADAMLTTLLCDVEELGYGVIPGVIEPEELAALREVLDRAAREDDDAGTASRYGPDQCNQRVWALLNRGDEFVRLATHPLALTVAQAQLGPSCLLSQLSANITSPGGSHEIGRLHTDQGHLPEPWPVLLAFNVYWFLDDFTHDNGATLVVPRSHKFLANPPHDLEPSTPSSGYGPGRVHGRGRRSLAPRDRVEPNHRSDPTRLVRHLLPALHSRPGELVSVTSP